MTAIWSVARAEVRRGWRTLLLVGLLAGVVAATTIGAGALARRTMTAYDRLGAATGLDDARGSVVRHLDLIDDIAALPQVEEAWQGRIGVAKLDGELAFLGIVSGPTEPSSLARPLVLDGRLPRDDGEPGTAEIALRDDFQRAFAVPLGTEIPVQFLTEADYFRFDSGFEGGEPHGPRYTLRVVGTVRTAGGYADTPPGFGGPDLLADPGTAVGGAFFLRLVDGAAGFDALAADVARLGEDLTLPPEASEFSVVDLRDPTAAAVAAGHTAGLLGRALLALAVAVGGAGVVAVTQVCARHRALHRADHRIESALGLTRGQQAAARLLVGAAPAVLAVTVAAIGVALAARVEPIGAVRQYEPSPGPALNLAMTAGGLAATLLVVLGAFLVAGSLGDRARARRPLRESRWAERLSRCGGGPEGVLGLRFALEPGRGDRAVPVRSAIAGAALGMAGVVAGLVFVSSLGRLLDSPVRTGVPYDVLVSDVGAEAMEPLLDDPLVGAVTIVESAAATIEGRDVSAHAPTPLDGRLPVDMEAGRLPRTPDEVVLGLRLARELGVSVGDTVTARDSRGREHELAVVGTGVVPPLNNEPLGLNALVTPEGLRERAGATQSFSAATVAVAPGGDPEALVSLLGEQFEADTQPAPIEVDNLRQLGVLPAAVAALIGAIAVIALVNALVVVVRRRRRDLALLRAIGCTGRQAAVTIVVMAVTIITLGLAAGIPLGVAAGSSLWRLTAEGAFVTGDPSLPWGAIAATAGAAFAITLVAAVLPARRAATLPAAAFLRTE